MANMRHRNLQRCQQQSNRRTQMFAVQMSVNVPSSIHIAQLREEFLELSDRLNLDAILEPVKG